MKLKSIIITSALAVAAAVAFAEDNNIAEEVAWVIGDEPIWKSEIEDMYQQLKYDPEGISGDPYCVIPERLAIEKLFLHQADLDTVEVQEGLVAQQVESQLNYYIANLGSREKVEQYFHKTIPQMREALLDMSRNRSRIQQVQRNLTADITSTPAEIRTYFNSLSPDSIPYVPQQVEVQILTINPAIPREEIEDIKTRLRDYTDRVTSGESDFSTLAILYSDDKGSASKGGELGFMGRGQLVPEFAAVAFNLNDPKKVSKIVETEFGYHIIQLIEKRGDRINVRHILLQPKVSDKDLIDATTRLDSLRADIVKHKKFTFEEAVAYISQDKDTHNNRGQMINNETGTTRFEMAQLPQEVGRQVAKMNVGDISEPFVMRDPKSNRDIVAIVKLTNRIDAHRANMSDDYQTIKDMYEASRRADIIARWINKKINDTYIRIEPNWANCNFTHNWLKK